MPDSSIKDIKLRIKSIRGTRQITRAMQLVASSKLRHAKERMEQSEPYLNALSNIITTAAESSGHSKSIFLDNSRERKKICVCVIAGDRGLAGGYNSRVLKAAVHDINDADAFILPIGKKAAEFFQDMPKPLTGQYSSADISMNGCSEIAGLLTKKFTAGEFDRLYLTYTKYKNSLKQLPVTVQVFPLPEREASLRASMEYEPSLPELLELIMPQYLAALLYNAASHAYVSELSARQLAMDTATSNADEILDNLTLQYNRIRQAGITREIIEISG